MEYIAILPMYVCKNKLYITMVIIAQFAGEVDLASIEGFTITLASLGGGTLVLYQYRPQYFNPNSGIETDGKTYVRNISFNIVSDETMIAVYITSNGTIHPHSPLFTVERCGSQDTTTTTTTTTTTGA